MQHNIPYVALECGKMAICKRKIAIFLYESTCFASFFGVKSSALHLRV